MALTTGQRRKAARWFVDKVFRKPKKVAVIDRTTLFSALDSIDAFIDGAPTADATNAVAIRNATGAQFRSPFNDHPDHTVAVAVAAALAAVALARTGSL